MIKRSLVRILPRVAAGYPVVAVTGPRQSGKTTLARKLFGDRPYVSLENPLERAAFEEDPRSWFARFPDGAVIDEVQRAPELPSWLQGLVDEDARMGRWILTGSQQYMVMDRISQSLAGRVALMELMPFDHGELTAAGLAPASLAAAVDRGGYPPLYDRPLEPARWLGDYLATYIERDVRQVIRVRDLNRFAAFVRLCATRIGQTVNHAAVAAELGIDAKTASGWLSALVAGYVVHLLPPHHANLGKRVVKHPKLYFLDTGLACRLLGIQGSDGLERHPAWGALVENWVIADVIKTERHAGRRADHLFWWRSHDGLEVDLVVEHGARLHPLEIKATRSPGAADATALRRFRELDPERILPGTLLHRGEDDRSSAGIRYAPWHRAAELVAAGLGS